MAGGRNRSVYCSPDDVIVTGKVDLVHGPWDHTSQDGFLEGSVQSRVLFQTKLILFCGGWNFAFDLQYAP